MVKNKEGSQFHSKGLIICCTPKTKHPRAKSTTATLDALGLRILNDASPYNLAEKIG